MRFKSPRGPGFKGDTIAFRAQVAPEQIGYINAIIESYEGIGIVRTRDEKQGIIEFWVPPHFVKEFKQILQHLKTEIDIQLLTVERTQPF